MKLELAAAEAKHCQKQAFSGQKSPFSGLFLPKIPLLPGSALPYFNGRARKRSRGRAANARFSGTRFRFGQWYILPDGGIMLETVIRLHFIR